MLHIVSVPALKPGGKSAPRPAELISASAPTPRASAPIGDSDANADAGAIADAAGRGSHGSQGGGGKPRHIPRRRLSHGGDDAASSSAGSFPMPKSDPSRAKPLPLTLPLSQTPPAGALTASTFGELPLDAYLSRQLDRLGLTSMTPVQRRTIPPILAGRDVVVRSHTGSGKTYAYGVPLLQLLVELGPSVVTRAAGTFALVLVPTRELAVQTLEALGGLARPFPWLVTCSLMGGERRKAEKARLRKGTALVVSTPGRLTDHLGSTTAFELGSCRLVVLDEADRCAPQALFGAARYSWPRTVLGYAPAGCVRPVALGAAGGLLVWLRAGGRWSASAGLHGHAENSR